MQNRRERKLNRYRYYLGFVQIVLLCIIFFVVFNNECAIFLKEFLNSIPAGHGVLDTVTMKGYMIFSAFSSSPSMMGLFIFLLQIAFFAFNIHANYLFIYKRVIRDVDTVETDVKMTEPKLTDFSRSYLENSRLRN